MSTPFEQHEDGQYYQKNTGFIPRNKMKMASSTMVFSSKEFQSSLNTTDMVSCALAFSLKEHRPHSRIRSWLTITDCESSNRFYSPSLISFKLYVITFAQKLLSNYQTYIQGKRILCENFPIKSQSNTVLSYLWQVSGLHFKY